MKRIDYKWIMLLLVSATYALAQGTRLIYTAVLPQIKADFLTTGVNDTKLGLVFSTFTLVFGLTMPFAGIFADRLKRKWIVIAGCALFSAGIFCSGFATGLGLLFLSYGIFNAIGQALIPPCASSLISQLHVETRGTAYSVYQAAIYLGIIVCSICSGYLASMGEDGWRKAFWLFGGLGIIVVLLMISLLKDTPQPHVSSDERPSVRQALGAFVSKPTALLLMGALGCYFFATYGFKTWSPMFMIRMFPDIPKPTAVFHAVFWFYIGAFAGVSISGRVSDKLKKRRITARLEIELVGILLCIPFVLLMASARSLPLMIVAITLFGFATGIYDSNLYAALMDVINPRYRAAATGIFGCGGCIFGAFGPAVMGWMNSAFSLRISFAVLSVFALICALFIAIAIKYTFKTDVI